VVTFQAAHRSQPGLQAPVVSLDRIIRVLLEGVQRRRDQLVQYPRVDRGAVSRDFDWDRARTQRPGKKRRAASMNAGVKRCPTR
jgi:hypothetical protein